MTSPSWPPSSKACPDKAQRKEGVSPRLAPNSVTGWLFCAHLKEQKLSSSTPEPAHGIPALSCSWARGGGHPAAQQCNANEACVQVVSPLSQGASKQVLDREPPDLGSRLAMTTALTCWGFSSRRTKDSVMPV